MKKTGSPWKGTPVTGKYLDVLEYRKIPASASDVTIKLDVRFVHSPDTLAHEYYGHSKYWWVIPTRNNLQDPIFDLVEGMELIIPHRSVVTGL